MGSSKERRCNNVYISFLGPRLRYILVGTFALFVLVHIISNGGGDLAASPSSQQQTFVAGAPIDVCFVSCIYSKSTKEADKPADVSRFKIDRSTTFRFFLYTNLGDLLAPGWTKVNKEMNYRRFITQSRYGKFMAWKDEEMSGCKTIFYFDGQYDINKSTKHQIFEMAERIRESSVGLAQVLHPRGYTVMDEYRAILNGKKDLEQNVNKTIAWLSEQPDFHNDCTLYANFYFGYDPKNKKFQEAAEFFWDYYSKEDGSWRDQPIWCYTLSHFGLEPIPMMELFKENMKRRGHSHHTYDERADGDAVTDITTLPVQEQVTQCRLITAEQSKALKAEIKDYERSPKFLDKIKEVKGEIGVAAHHVAIDKYLKEKVLKPGWSVLELGCATGQMLQMVQQAYEGGIGDHKELVGIELVTGWAEFAKGYHEKIKVFEGDITEFSLPDPFAKKTFDFVMLNDVVEHIQKERYGCFFRQLDRVTHMGSIVYMHTPTPQAQLADDGQFLENVIPHHYLILGMALAGFELITMEHDVDTKCGGKSGSDMPRALEGASCMFNKWPKYYHAVFRRAEDTVLTLA